MLASPTPLPPVPRPVLSNAPFCCSSSSSTGSDKPGYWQATCPVPCTLPSNGTSLSTSVAAAGRPSSANAISSLEVLPMLELTAPIKYSQLPSKYTFASAAIASSRPSRGSQ
eukprot:2870812-Rhodomonas_salina.3